MSSQIFKTKNALHSSMKRTSLNFWLFLVIIAITITLIFTSFLIFIQNIQLASGLATIVSLMLVVFIAVYNEMKESWRKNNEYKENLKDLLVEVSTNIELTNLIGEIGRDLKGKFIGKRFITLKLGQILSSGTIKSNIDRKALLILQINLVESNYMMDNIIDSPIMLQFSPARRVALAEQFTDSILVDQNKGEKNEIISLKSRLEGTRVFLNKEIRKL